jgi:hypothetical protein
MILQLLMPRFLGELYEDTQYLLSCQLSVTRALSTKANVIHTVYILKGAKDWLEWIDEHWHSGTDFTKY